MQQVGVDGKRGLAPFVLCDRDLMLLGEFDQLGARREVPFAPRGDHLHVGLEGVVGELEPHLIVAFAGGAVRNRIGTDLLGDLDLLLRDQWPRNRGTEEILAFIERIGAKHRKYIVADELFT